MMVVCYFHKHHGAPVSIFDLLIYPSALYWNAYIIFRIVNFNILTYLPKDAIERNYVKVFNVIVLPVIIVAIGALALIKGINNPLEHAEEYKCFVHGYTYNQIGLLLLSLAVLQVIETRKIWKNA